MELSRAPISKKQDNIDKLTMYSEFEVYIM